MEKIAVITDSTSDLSDELQDALRIHSLPLKVVYSERTYQDRIEITPEEVYRRFSEEIPKTSMPTPHEILALFEKLKEEGFTHVICLHISSGLSGTVDVVRSMARQVKELTIEVVDSKSLSMGLGWQVLEAARNIHENMPFKSVVEKAHNLVPQSKTFFVVKTLEYLRKGGRIGYVRGTLGEFLKIKPIISINEEGKYYNLGHARGRIKSLDNLFEIIKEGVEGGLTKVAICHGDAEEEARHLLARIKELPSVKETYFGQISPVMVVHTGPGLVGATMVP